MDERIDPRSHPPVPTPSGRMAAELSNGLRWLHERAWPIGGLSVALPILCLYHYTQIDHVPLSLTSNAFLGALPAVFAILVFTVLALSLFLILPSLVLLTPVTAQGKSLADSAAEDPARWRRLGLRWLLALAGLTALLAACVYGADRLGGQGQRIVTWALIIGLVGSFPLLAAGIRAAGVRWRDTSTDFRMTCLGGAYFQLIIMTLLLMASVGHADGERPWEALFIGMVAIAAVAAIQIVTARFAATLRTSPHPLTSVTRVIVAIVMTSTLVPGIGGTLAGHAVQATAMGGRTCVHLDRAPGADEPQASTMPPARIRILAVDTDHYIVREAHDGGARARSAPVRFIRRVDVAGLRDCQELAPCSPGTSTSAARQGESHR